MGVSLQKGQKVELTKTNPGLTKVVVGLGWDVNKYDGGYDFDLDAAAFMLGDSGKVTQDEDFIFYNNPQDAAGSVVHLGDNLTGAGEGDDEQVTVDLSQSSGQYPEHCLYRDHSRCRTARSEFRTGLQLRSSGYLKPDSGEELIRYDLSEDYSVETALVVGGLYRHGSEWKFNAIGSGFQGGLGALCQNFGVNI